MLITCFFVPTFVNAENNKNIERYFKDYYKQPVVDLIYSTSVSGLRYCSVFDHSQLAEDPLIPDMWLLSSDNHVFKTDIDGIRKALQYIKYDICSEKKALNSALLFINGKRMQPVMDDDYYQYLITHLPKSISLKLKTPIAIKNNDSYSVTIQVLYCDRYMHKFSKTEVTAEFLEYTFTINNKQINYTIKSIISFNPEILNSEGN